MVFIWRWQPRTLLGVGVIFLSPHSPNRAFSGSSAARPFPLRSGPPPPSAIYERAFRAIGDGAAFSPSPWKDQIRSGSDSFLWAAFFIAALRPSIFLQYEYSMSLRFSQVRRQAHFCQGSLPFFLSSVCGGRQLELLPVISIRRLAAAKQVSASSPPFFSLRGEKG